ncbi:hypothetical protein BROUX41_006481 [Berkeleyomyces rouxiae]
MSSTALLRLAQAPLCSRLAAPSLADFVQARAASSFSAIHRGVRASSRATGGRSFGRHDRNDKTRAGGWDKRPGSRDKGMSRMSDSDIRKAIAGEAGEEESDRRTRRSRFHDASESHGKNSLVYMMKYGPLKEKADMILSQKAAEASAASRKARGLPEEEPETDSFHRDSGSSYTPRKRDSDFQFSRERFNDRKSPGSFENTGRFSERSPRSSDRRSSAPSLRDRDSSRSSFGGNRDYDRNMTPSFSDKPRRERTQHDMDRKDFGDRRSSSSRQDHGFQRSRRPDHAQNLSKDLTFKEDRKPAIIGSPVVPYTTAASQFIFGKSAVKAALHANRRKLYKLYIYNGDNRKGARDDALFISLAKKNGIAWELVPTNGQPMMDRMSQGRPHNGYILEASPLPQPPVVSLGSCSSSGKYKSFEVKLGFQTREEHAINGADDQVVYDGLSKPNPLVLLLHEVVDPGNLGGIIRTAHFMGVSAVVITKHNSATLTPIVMKAAAGAAEQMPVLVVENPTDFVEKSRDAGWRIFAAVAPDLRNAERHAAIDVIAELNPLATYPSILVLGSEGQGIPRHLRKRIDMDVSIPRLAPASEVDSLNVSVAAGLLCHAFLKRHPDEAVKSDPVAAAMGMGEATLSVEAVTSALASVPEAATEEDDGESLF